MPLTTKQDQPSAPLRNLVVRGTTWTLLGYGSAQFLRLAGNIVLTRLLFPEAFGLMALVSVFMQGLNMFSDIGIKPSIVQNKNGDNPDFLNTAWTIQIIRGVVLWIIACISAYPFSLFYGEPLLAWLIPISGLTALIGGFESTAVATANRQIKLKITTLILILGQAASIGVMVAIAVLFETVWALVAGGLTASLVQVTLSHIWLAKEKNHLCWDLSAAQSLVRFGKWIFASTLLSFCVSQADRLIFGQLIPPGVLGVYSIALHFAALPRDILTRLGGQIIFPLYSHKFRENGSLNIIFFRVRSILVTYGGASTAFLFISAPFIINTLYDSRYIEAGWILQTLSIGVWLHILECTSGSALLAIGKPQMVAFGNGAKLLGMLILIPIGHIVWGFQGAVAGFALSECFRYIYSVTATLRIGLNVLYKDFVLILLWGVTAGVGTLTLRTNPVHDFSNSSKIAISIILVLLAWAPLMVTSVIRSRGRA